MRNIYFELLSKKPIAEDTAKEHQFNLGKHFAGYGFYGFTCKLLIDGPFKNYYEATWHCQDSCE